MRTHTHILRLLGALALMGGGLLLGPAEALPRRPFTWLNYVSLHSPPPSVDIEPRPSNDQGLMTIQGSGFAPERSVLIALNRSQLTSVSTDDKGEFVMRVDGRLMQATTNEITATGLAVEHLTTTQRLQIASTEVEFQRGVMSAAGLARARSGVRQPAADQLRSPPHRLVGCGAAPASEPARGCAVR